MYLNLSMVGTTHPKHHNSYSYSVQNTERLKIFQFTLSCKMAEFNHNGLLVNLHHGPKILLHNLFISALSGSELTFSYILVSPGRQLPTNYQWLQ